MKQLRKEFFRSLHNTKMRYLSIAMIVALGVAFFSGVRASKPDMQITADQYFDNAVLWDIRVVTEGGMREEDIDRISKVDGVELAEGGYSRDVLCENGKEQISLRILSLQENVNQIELKEGRMPQAEDECVLDFMLKGDEYQIGDTIQLKSGDDIPLEAWMAQTTYTIVGFAGHPYYLSRDRGTSSVGNGDLAGFVMVQPECFQVSHSIGDGVPVENVYTEVLVSVEGAQDLQCFSGEYEDLVEKVIKKLEDLNGDWYVLNRDSIQNFQEYGEDAERIGAIGEVFPLIFFLVAALVSLTTMTRMVEEERTQIGTLNALGYGKGAIAAKYIIYGLSATLIGSAIGVLAGQWVLPVVIINAYAILYNSLTKVQTPLQAGYAISSTAVAVLCTLLATVGACYKELLSVPAQLMRPEAPKSGKRVFMEKISFIWKRLKFSHKATVRNLIRYKKRFFMTVFGIGGCTALIVVGFGLKDSVSSIGEHQFGDINVYDANILLDVSKDIETIYKKLQEEAGQCMYVYENAFDVGKNSITKSSYVIVPSEPEDLSSFIHLKNRETKEEYKLNDKEIIISEKLSRLLEVQAGDTIYIKESDTERREVKIAAISENYFMHYVYMSPVLYQEIFGEEPVFNGIYVNFAEGKSGKEYEKEFFEEFASMDGIAELSFTSGIAGRVSDMLESMDAVIVVLVISAGLLSFIVLFNLNNINISERIRELATLKVLGFYDMEVAWYVYRENICLTVIGTAIGLLLGVVLHRFVIVTAEIDILMFSREIKLLSFIYAVFLTMLFAMVVNLFMYRKCKKIDMIRSLKSVE